MPIYKYTEICINWKSWSDLTELLRLATKDQLFQFEGRLYEQVDGVAMGSPLGPLMANAFLCSIEDKLERENKLPDFTNGTLTTR